MSPKYINRRRRPGAFLVGGAVVDGLVGFHLRPQGLHPRRTGNHQQVGVGHGLHHQIASVFERELSGALALLGSVIALAEAVIKDAEGGVSARIGIVERADDRRSRKAAGR